MILNDGKSRSDASNNIVCTCEFEPRVQSLGSLHLVSVLASWFWGVGSFGE